MIEEAYLSIGPHGELGQAARGQKGLNGSPKKKEVTRKNALRAQNI